MYLQKKIKSQINKQSQGEKNIFFKTCNIFWKFENFESFLMTILFYIYVYIYIKTWRNKK
jgi:hypothetical protein